MNRKPLLTLMTFVTLVSVGCGVAGGSAGVSTVIDGTWVGPCSVNSGSGNIGASSLHTLVFGGGSYSLYEYNYSNNNCTGGILLTLVESGTFSVGGVDANLTSATDIDFIQSANTATPGTGEAAALNSQHPCGTGATFTDNQPTSVAGLTCGSGGDSGPQTSNGARILSLFVITGNAIQLGNSNGSHEELGVVAPGARPTQVNGSTTYTN